MASTSVSLRETPRLLSSRLRLGRLAILPWPVFAAFLLSRVGLEVAGLVAPAANPASLAQNQGVVLPWVTDLPAWLNPWVRCDAGFYVRIAQDGYLPDFQRAAFAPLLSALMRLAALGSPDPTALSLAGFVLSNGALLVALVLLVRLVAADHGPRVATTAAIMWLLWPTSLFLSSPYPHSLFVACALGALAATRSGRWWLAGALVALAALARPYGVLLVLPVALELARASGWRWPGWRRAAPLALPPAVALAWQGVLWWWSGDPLLAAHQQADWGRHLMPPWDTLRDFFRYGPTWYGLPSAWTDLALVIALLPLLVLGWRLLRPSWALWATLLYLPMIASGVLMSDSRFVLELVPAWVVLARLSLRWPRVFRYYRAIAVPVGLFAMWIFAQGGWVG